MKPDSRGGATCYVPGCKNNSYGSRSRPKLSFHRIPMKLIIKEKWLKAIQRDKEPFFNYVTKKVCSDHFNHDDFWAGSNSKKLLKDNVVPTLKLPSSEPAGKQCYVRVITQSKSTGEQRLEIYGQGGEAVVNNNVILEHKPMVFPKMDMDALLLPVPIKMEVEGELGNALEGFSFENPFPNAIRIEESIDGLENTFSVQKPNGESGENLETSSTSGESAEECEDGCEGNHHPNVPREFVEAFHSYAISPAKLADKLKSQEAVIGRLKMKIRTMDRQHTRLKMRVGVLEHTLKDLGLKKRTIRKNKNVPKDVEKVLDVTHNGVPIYLVKSQRDVDESTGSLRQEHNDDVSSSDSS